MDNTKVNFDLNYEEKCGFWHSVQSNKDTIFQLFLDGLNFWPMLLNFVFGAKNTLLVIIYARSE